MNGALEGIRVVELAGLGPGPFCAMVLADMGADVIRVDKVAGSSLLGNEPGRDPVGRGRRSIAVDLKAQGGVDVVLRLAGTSDVLIEGFRPGVAERLGVGPEACRELNPRLVYGRMTGWGQTGPLAAAAGHDINYIALAGALHLGTRQGQRPTPTANLVADYGGGGMLLAVGILAALLERHSSGLGQVVDAAMVDGSALLTTMIHGLRAQGLWRDEAGVNVLDTGAPFYDTYTTSDGRHVAVGAIEPQFYAAFVSGLGLDIQDLPPQMDPSTWDDTRNRFQEIIGRHSRSHWEEVFADTDACVSPVLDLGEAPLHPHNAERSTFTEVDGVIQPAPAPRLSRTPGVIRRPSPAVGGDTRPILEELGFDDTAVAELFDDGTVA